MKRILVLALALLLGAAFGGARSLSAQQPRSGAELETAVKALSAELRCPVCQGLSLKDSPTELSMEMKSVIRQQLAEGKTPEEVKQYFVGRYGEWILMEPTPQGFNLLVYILPWVGLALGGMLVFFLVRRWTRPQPDPLAALAGAPAPTEARWPED